MTVPADSTASPAEANGDTPISDTAPAAVTTPPDTVATDVAEQLLAGTLEGVTTELPPEPTPDEPTETPPETPEVPETPPVETPPAPAVPATPPATPAAEDADPVVDVPHPYDRPDDPTPADIPRDKTKLHATFEKQREKLREARQVGEFGQMMADIAYDAGIDPNALASIVGLTARARKGDQIAAQELPDVLRKLGIVLPAGAAPAPQTPPPAAPAGPTDAAVDAVYRELFAKDVQDLHMSEDLARQKARLIAARQQPPPPPAPAQPAPALSQPAPTQHAAPPVDPVTAAANQALAGLATQYDTAYRAKGKDFTPIRDEALKRIAAEVKRTGQPVPPVHWSWKFNQVVQQIQTEKAQAATAARTAPVQARNTLRASSGGGAPAAAADPLAGIVDTLMNGKVDTL